MSRLTLVVLFTQQNTWPEELGTGVFAPLNIVHVKYRGFFVERFKCCGHPLREVWTVSMCWLQPAQLQAVADHAPHWHMLKTHLVAAVCSEALCEGFW